MAIQETEQGVFGQELVESDSPQQSIIRLAESGASPEVLAKYMDLQERWAASRAAESYSVALATFQAKCPQIHKGRTVSLGGGGFAYAGFDDIMLVISPLLRECGIAVTFDTEPTDNGVKATCHVRHGVHRESSSVTIPVPQMKVNDAQRSGAAFSYAKRYALQNALNIVVTDEDTNAAGLGEAITEEQAIVLNEMLGGLKDPAKETTKFLGWLKVSRVGDVPASRYEEARAALRNKLNKEEKERKSADAKGGKA